MVLFAAGVVLSGNSPALNASTAKITQYYQNHHAAILVSELLINLASVVLLWFLSAALVSLHQPYFPGGRWPGFVTMVVAKTG